MDGYDFHSVSLSVSRLAVYYGQGKAEREHISLSITLTLLFRSVGAIIFGLAGDLYGRKWPMVINLMVIAVLQLATAFCETFQSFLGVRALFGIGMGGIWGLSASMALENMPMEARGLFSGILQQGYALGYLIAAGINMGVVPNSKHSFKMLYYIGAGLTFAVALARCCFPESKQFIEAKRNGGDEISGKMKVRLFMNDARKILREYWKRCIYAVILMALFNYMSHTSQDMYPTYMQQTKGFSAMASSKATMIAKTGAVVGGTFCGYYSQFFGRRATIMIACALGAALIPLWVLPNTFASLVTGAFLLQFMVQGAWGVVPIHLNELSPPQFRSSFPGICYQLGNMISAPAAQISATISESLEIHVRGEVRPDYAITQAIMMSVIFSLLLVWTACGQEQRGSHFELAKTAGEAEGKERELEDGDKHGVEAVEMAQR
ncbi:major facilitator superfamily domain-containing protein [Sphaerosporella brunnea]|uniref:Major facilitator superfamily domain-containing protein n=1 Tax=Sphaerosporella brunnea TaxID=1250544 RepID=A0A5J5EXT8_9PEZI|nr:major facilitator superfamily domain-containing protein [Sphaerosporella brunnea]